ncbi:GNAT family N-acetyltransferase [Gaetbulibacter sp. M240]|uniref:GNAT family N-acetyltransferase n=1 Tax=Gaetbulibacter sp. M240 TaxID=3126511 RepID=UPI00374EE045
MNRAKTDPVDFEIKEIGSKETYSVRHPVLRKGQPLASCAFDGDDLKTTIHLGIFDSKKLVGVATLLKNNNPDFKAPIQYQLRGMAILESHQKKGLGNQLLAYAEALLVSKQIGFIWCNAREIATNFYKNNGFSISGEPFDIPIIGTHFKMYKWL